MRNLLSIILLGFFILLGFGSVEESNDDVTTTKKNYIVPSKFINKKIHPYPFWCEEYLLIDNNMEFTRVEYNSRIYNLRESVTIKGKLNSDGTITFYTSNEWYFGGNTHKTKMLDKWEVDDYDPNNIQFSFYDYGYMNRGPSDSGWEEYSVWYRDDECNYTY